MLLGDMLMIVVVVLRLLVRLLSHALYGWKQLVCSWRGSETSRRPRCKAIGGHWYVCVGLLRRIHLSPTYVFGRDYPRLILECDLIFGAFGNQIGVLLAGCVKEVELLAPITVALRLCAVVATRLVLVALQMPFPARQASCARPLRLAFWGSVALPLLRRLVAWRVIPRRRCDNNSASHPVDLSSASSWTGTEAPRSAQHFEDEGSARLRTR